jgi:hypothetical protein
MNRFSTFFLIGVLLSGPMVSAEPLAPEAKAEYLSAKTRYRDAVRRFGKESSEARSAKRDLRKVRKKYHIKRKRGRRPRSGARDREKRTEAGSAQTPQSPPN